MQGIILGCGPSVGVPSLRWGWGMCDPTQKKNQRTRSSFFFKNASGSWLIDASPDLRFQCLSQEIRFLNGVLCTHSHMDHIGGVGDLVAFSASGPVPFYTDASTWQSIQTMLPHACLGPGRFLDFHLVSSLFYLLDMPVVSFIQNHGHSYSLGYRFPTWAYSTDLVELSEEAFDILKGIDTWIVACLSPWPNPKHAHLERVLSWVERIKPKRTVLTHMNSDLDYETLKRQLPLHIEPGFDGMVLSL